MRCRLQDRIEELEEQVAQLKNALMDDGALYVDLVRRGQCRALFSTLMKRETVSHDGLITVLDFRNRRSERHDYKHLTTLISYLRADLRIYSIEIETMHGWGYRINPTMKKKVKEICGSMQEERIAA